MSAADDGVSAPVRFSDRAAAALALLGTVVGESVDHPAELEDDTVTVIFTAGELHELSGSLERLARDLREAGL